MDPDQRIIPRVDKVDGRILGFVPDDKSSWTGWHVVKADLLPGWANSLGIKVIHLRTGWENAFLRRRWLGPRVLSFQATGSNLKAKTEMLASGSITLGSIFRGQGAAKLCRFGEPAECRAFVGTGHLHPG